jgi:hypothetical protein
MATVDEVAGGTLGEINIALTTANIYLPALMAQIDVAISLGLGPLKFDLAAQLNATIAAQATLAIQVSNPLAALQLSISALAQLQASLQAALALPSISVNLTAELSATASLAATLTAKLGIIEGVISAALAVKLPAINFVEGLGVLGLGPAILLSFDGITDGGTTMAEIGDLIRAKLQSPVTFGGDTIEPGDFVGGVIILTSVSPVLSALGTLFAGLV